MTKTGAMASDPTAPLMGGVYSSMRTWQRVRALNAADRGLIFEAAAWLCFVRVGISALPFLLLRRTLTSLSRGPDRAGTAGRPAARVAWAVKSAAQHLPIATTCLIESLAAEAMPRRH